VDRSPEQIDVVLVNAPPEHGPRIARALVERRLAACVNLIPAVTSFYRWEGAIQQDTESTLLIKTRRSLVAALTEAVKELHPYTVPEVLVLPASAERSSAPYVSWVLAETLAADGEETRGGP
jgi:periplasmic divalent cation tolerance protein